MKKIKRIWCDERRVGRNRIRDIPEPEAKNPLLNQLKSAFMENCNREEQMLIDSLEAREQLDDLKQIDNADRRMYWIGDNSGQPNANGDIINWSGCQNMNDGEIVCNTAWPDETSIHTGSHTNQPSCDYTYIGDGLYPNGDNLYTGIGDIEINWTPSITGPPPHTITTVPLGGLSYSIGTTNFGPNKNEKYAVMELPRKDVPMAVFVCGRMVTLGILGTEVECAFTGDKLVFEPGVVGATSFGDRITVSIEYDDEIIHYNIGQDSQVTYINERSSTLEVTLVSTIKKKVGANITGAQ